MPSCREVVKIKREVRAFFKVLIDFNIRIEDAGVKGRVVKYTYRGLRYKHYFSSKDELDGLSGALGRIESFAKDGK